MLDLHLVKEAVQNLVMLRIARSLSLGTLSLYLFIELLGWVLGVFSCCML